MYFEQGSEILGSTNVGNFYSKHKKGKYLVIFAVFVFNLGLLFCSDVNISTCEEWNFF